MLILMIQFSNLHFRPLWRLAWSLRLNFKPRMKLGHFYLSISRVLWRSAFCFAFSWGEFRLRLCVCGDSWFLLCSVMSVVYVWFLCMTTHPLGYTMYAGARVLND
jgi:hypothetical protein